jgi:hypothetical protein
LSFVRFLCLKKLEHGCEVISVAAEFMVDVAGVKLEHACGPMACLLDVNSHTGCHCNAFPNTEGCAEPSKYRASSAIYVNLFANGGLMLDAGGGTWTEMTRAFGHTAAEEKLLQLNCLWISHRCSARL